MHKSQAHAQHGMRKILAAMGDEYRVGFYRLAETRGTTKGQPQEENKALYM
jgi:hypothetical protein